MITTIWDITDDIFEQFVRESTSWHELAVKCGYKNTGNYTVIKKRISMIGLHTDHLYKNKSLKIPFKRYSNEEIFCENSKYSDRNKIKKRMIKDYNFERKCSSCFLSEWKDKPIPIELDHINGINNDNRIENLRFLCPNCHAMTDTYKGKNITHKKPDFHCVDCKNLIYKTSTRCRSCQDKCKHADLLKNIIKPSFETLLRDTKEMGFTQTGEKYNVSRNTISRWIKNYKNDLKINEPQ